jgi:exopolysaccharide production protein ExoZ
MRETISIQYLRAIAATMVVVYHTLTRVVPVPTPEPFFLGGWASGVDVFFVVSGFIMWSTTVGRRVSTRAFFEARLIRILPLYWTALAAYWVILALERGIDLAPGLWDVVRSGFFIPYQDSTTGFLAPYLTPGWTLTYEMAFYAIFAVALTLEHKVARLALVTMAFAAMISLRFRFGTDSPILFRLTSPLFFEFLAGMVIAEIFGALRDKPLLPRLGVPVLGVAALFVAFVSGPDFNGSPRILDFGLPAALVVFGFISFEGVLARHPIGWLKRIGDASYSLYLVHDLYLHLVRPYLAASGLGPWTQGAIYVAGSLTVGLLCHTWVEQPLTRRVKAWRSRTRIETGTTSTFPIGGEVAPAHGAASAEGSVPSVGLGKATRPA